MSRWLEVRKMADFSLARFLLFVALSERGLFCVGYLDPFLIWQRLDTVVVMPVPPFVRRSLRVTLGRIFPSLLTTERCNVEKAPDSPHRLVPRSLTKYVRNTRSAS